MYYYDMGQSFAVVGGAQRRGAVRVSGKRHTIEMWLGSIALSRAEIVKLINLSATGALLELEKPIPLNHAVRCRFSLPGAGFFSLEATPVRLVKTHNRYLVGVRFSVAQSTESRLMRWVFRELAAAPQT